MVRRQIVGNSKTILFILECRHVALAPCRPTIKLACIHPECDGEERRVRGIHVYEWHATCHDCNFSRWTGLSKETALAISGKHRVTKRHDATVEYDPNPTAKLLLLRMFQNALVP